MSTNKTKKYNLHAWAPKDDFLLKEINENFTGIDTALGEKTEIVTGITTGDGEKSQFIALGFTPRAVLLAAQNGHTNGGYMGYGGLALPGYPVKHTAGIPLSIEEGGFTIATGDSGSSHVYSNKSGQVCYYLAFR